MICGRGGQRRHQGRGGNDRLYGGDGDDPLIEGGKGNDSSMAAMAMTATAARAETQRRPARSGGVGLDGTDDVGAPGASATGHLDRHGRRTNAGLFGGAGDDVILGGERHRWRRR